LLLNQASKVIDRIKISSGGLVSTAVDVRINLYKKYPESLKVVHLLPALFTIGIVFLLLCSLVCSWSLSLLLLFALIICVDSTLRNKSFKIGLLSILASFIQLIGYGTGFLRAWWKRCVLGKNEFAAFEKNFYK
jgi:hypothetical protein